MEITNFRNQLKLKRKTCKKKVLTQINIYKINSMNFIWWKIHPSYQLRIYGSSNLSLAYSLRPREKTWYPWKTHVPNIGSKYQGQTCGNNIYREESSNIIYLFSKQLILPDILKHQRTLRHYAYTTKLPLAPYNVLLNITFFSALL